MSIAAQIEMSKNRTSLQNRHSPIAEGHNVRNDDLRHAHNTTAPDAGDAPEDDKLDDCAREPRGERADHEYAHREAERELSAEDVAKAPICEARMELEVSIESKTDTHVGIGCIKTLSLGVGVRTLMGHGASRKKRGTRPRPPPIGENRLLVLTNRLESSRGEEVRGGHPGCDGAGVEEGRDGREGGRDDRRVEAGDEDAEREPEEDRHDLSAREQVSLVRQGDGLGVRLGDSRRIVVDDDRHVWGHGPGGRHRGSGVRHVGRKEGGGGGGEWGLGPQPPETVSLIKASESQVGQ